MEKDTLNELLLDRIERSGQEHVEAVKKKDIDNAFFYAGQRTAYLELYEVMGERKL